MTTVGYDPQTHAALAVARSLAAAGIPIFIAQPDPSTKTGYRPPMGWQRTTPDPAVIDAWRPGLALCAVMGCGLDLIDIDPRNGGDPGALNGTAPRVLGIAATPSGGTHWFIRSLGTGSRDNVAPGIDVKGGIPDGSSRGFAFLAPTVRASSVTGALGAYQWTQTPDVTALSAPDDSGAALAARIRALRAESNVVRDPDGPAWWVAFLTQSESQSVGAANRAIEAKVGEVTGWKADSGVGFRTALLRAALTLGGYVGAGHLDEHDARERLEAACTAVWGAPDVEDRRWIQQGLDDGAVRPFHVYRDEPLYEVGSEVVIDTPLNADEDPNGLRVHQVVSEPDSLFWLLAEMGVRGLAGMFRRGRSLVHCSRVHEEGYLAAPEGDDNGPATVHPVAGRALQARTALYYLVWRWAGGKRDPHRIKILLPMPVCEAALAVLDDAPYLRPLRGVTHTPMVRADGSILDIPGYDDATGFLYLPDGVVPPIPEIPTREDVAAAVALLRGLVVDFTWAGEHDEANYLGLLLTPLLRQLCPPPYKMAAVMARQPGSGKSLLAKIPRLVHGGVFRAEMPADDAELAKSITSILTQTTAPVVQIDNVTGVLRSSRLAGLLTSAVYSDRVLGSTNNVDMVNDRLWTITGNNLALGGDLIRRTVWVTIDPRVPNPEQRTGFTIEDLPAYVVEHRGEILRALLVLVRAWVVAGRPAQLQASDDYARWSAVVRGILQVAGVPGRFDHTESRQQALGTGDDDWQTFLEAAYDVFGERPWAVKELLVKVHDGREAPFGLVDTYTAEHPIPLDALPAELVERAAHRGGVSTQSKGLGRWLMNREGRWAGDLCARRAGTDPHHKIQLWRVERYPTQPSGPAYPPPVPKGPNSVVPGTDPAGFGGVGGGAFSRPPPAKNKKQTNPPKNFSLPRAHPPPHPPQTPQTILKPEIGARADADGITKAEARKLIASERKAAERQAKIDAAAGEYLGLPAVADRDGHALPVTLEQAQAVVRSALDRAGALTVDVETSGYPVGHEHYRLRTVQLGDEVAAAVLDPVEHADAIRELLAAAPRLHAHSATADLVPLAHAGLIDAESGWDRMYDTVIPAKLADPRSTGSDPGLKALAGVVLGAGATAPAADVARDALFSASRWLKSPDVETPVERSGWAQVDPGCATMVRYAASDVLDTAALARRLPPIPPAILERERLAQRMTARVAHRGVRIDGDHVRMLTEQHTAARADWATKVQACGIDNPGSSKQVAEALSALGAPLPRSEKTGAPSAAAGAIEPLRTAEGPVGALADAVLWWRHHDTVLGTFLEPYRQLCERGDGRARPTVYTLGTDTGRMSCVRPNLQQLPREGGVRACITADPGQLMIGADFSGVEIRVAAALSQDPTLLRLLAEGRDLHAEIALQVFGPDAEATAKAGGVPTASKANRYTAKRIVFGRLYGGGIPTLAAQGGCSVETAQRAVDTLDALTPQLSAWSTQIRDAVRSGHTQFPSYSGRIIHLPREYPHKGPNYCIQGSARELLIDALERWHTTRWGTCTLLPVHDELDVFVPAEDADEATEALVSCMRSELCGVQIVADPSKPAYAWADSI